MIKLPQKTIQKTIAILLAMVLLVPANAGAATWMALSMSDTHPIGQIVQMNDVGVSHHAEDSGTDHGMHHSQQTDRQSHKHDEGHEHGEEECNEHCVSCANHCSSVAIPFDNFMLSDLSKRSLRFESGNLSGLSDLLFRPPIHV